MQADLRENKKEASGLSKLRPLDECQEIYDQIADPDNAPSGGVFTLIDTDEIVFVSRKKPFSNAKASRASR